MENEKWSRNQGTEHENRIATHFNLLLFLLVAFKGARLTWYRVLCHHMGRNRRCRI